MSPKAAASPAPSVSSPEQLRNVVLVGHSGSGKTTLFHHLVAATSEGYRPPTDEPERSVSLSVATVPNDDTVLTLVDAPGYPDFVGELRAGLRAADAALFVVSAADGVDAATTMLWQECAAVGMPRMVVVTKLDTARSDFDDTVAICQRVFGEGVMPVYLPLLGDDESIIGNLGLITRTVSDYSNPEGHEVHDRRARQVHDAEERHRELIEDQRSDLVEAIIQESEDDPLLDRYLGGEEIDAKTVVNDLLVAVARGSFHPVVPVSTQTGVGTQELLYLLASAFPAPPRRPLPAATTPEGEPLPPLACDPDAPLVAEVVRSTTDPYVGRISLVRVFSGTLLPDTAVHVSGHLDRFATHELEGHDDHDTEERVGLLSSPLGDGLRPKERALAGEVVVVAKLAQAETSDTLSARDRPALVEPWVLPEALLPVAIHAVSSADEDKLAGALPRLVAEDPTMRLERSAETHQVVLWTMGQAHVDLLLQRLEERYGVKVESEPLRVALRETFTTSAEGQGRNIKQSGGHGQYAVCRVTVEPLERGAGFEFVDKVVGGAVPRQFIASVEKGVRAQLEKGVLAGFPLVDVRVTLHDGKAHSVDSSDMAFQTAGALALKDAASPQTVTLLEPVDTVTVLVADEYVGGVMTDLQTRRGRVLSSQPDDTGRTTIHAEVPQTEITRYAIDLRSVSHGTGSFTREPLQYEPLPAHLVSRYLAEE
jgi:elongation factor G